MHDDCVQPIERGVTRDHPGDRRCKSSTHASIMPSCGTLSESGRPACERIVMIGAAATARVARTSGEHGQSFSRTLTNRVLDGQYCGVCGLRTRNVHGKILAARIISVTKYRMDDHWRSREMRRFGEILRANDSRVVTTETGSTCPLGSPKLIALRCPAWQSGMSPFGFIHQAPPCTNEYSRARFRVG
jgi:hypothetical protein